MTKLYYSLSLSLVLALVMQPGEAFSKHQPDSIYGVLQDDVLLGEYLRRKGSTVSVEQFRQRFCPRIVGENGKNGVFYDTGTTLSSLIYCEGLINAGVYRDRNGALVNLANDWCRRWQSGRSECLAGQGIDQLGKPKITGWVINNLPERRMVKYKAPAGFYKVNVRGIFGRYYETKYIIRAYEPGHGGLPGSLTQTGQYETTCFSTSYSTRCSTKPPSFSYIPGVRPKPSEIVQFTKRIIWDCEEGTVAVFIDDKVTMNWTRDTRFDDNEIICQNVSALMKSDFYGLANGEPTYQDQKWR